MDGADRIMTRDVCRTFKTLKCTQDCVKHNVDEFKTLVDEFSDNFLDTIHLIDDKWDKALKSIEKKKDEALNAMCDNVNHLHEGVTLKCKYGIAHEFMKSLVQGNTAAGGNNQLAKPPTNYRIGERNPIDVGDTQIPEAYLPATTTGKPSGIYGNKRDPADLKK